MSYPQVWWSPSTPAIRTIKLRNNHIMDLQGTSILQHLRQRQVHAHHVSNGTCDWFHSQSSKPCDNFYKLHKHLKLNGSPELFHTRFYNLWLPVFLMLHINLEDWKLFVCKKGPQWLLVSESLLNSTKHISISKVNITPIQMKLTLLTFWSSYSRLFI